MLISSKSEYGLRALMDIAINEDGTPVSRSGISERQQIPLPYLTQVLRILVNGGLLKSNRGPSGGYSLNRDMREISVLDVVTLLQGPVSPAGCAGAGGSTAGCEKLDSCGLVGVWSELKSSSENVLGQTTLHDLISTNGSKQSYASEDEIAEKLDCIGVSCPLPIVHIAETMRKLGTGQILEVWADDEGAKADIPAWCMGTGNDFIGREEFGDQMKFLIRKVV
ncbi:MAG: Rrf2 family transcriptional regulator [Actinobacteria bacterium]|nr:Rrf2 family transcriptional regulator [Actinomycetota bacterium]